MKPETERGFEHLVHALRSTVPGYGSERVKRLGTLARQASERIRTEGTLAEAVALSRGEWAIVYSALAMLADFTDDLAHR